MHLVFFDHECPFCQKRILFLLKIDREKKLFFAPLKGKTADQYLTGNHAYLKQIDRLVLIENFRKEKKTYWVGGKAVFRILYLFGGKWKFLGILYLLPAFLIEPIYHFIATHRYALGKKQKKPFPMPPDRFLP